MSFLAAHRGLCSDSLGIQFLEQLLLAALTSRKSPHIQSLGSPTGITPPPCATRVYLSPPPRGCFPKQPAALGPVDFTPMPGLGLWG